MDTRLAEQFEAILTGSEGPEVRRREAGRPVWDLSRPGPFARNRRRRYQAAMSCRDQLLSALLSSGRIICQTHQESPDSYPIPGDWGLVGPSTWLVPQGLDVRYPDVRHWLFDLGGWSMYIAASPAPVDGPDVFRCRAVDLLAWMNANSVQIMIASFLDDSDWVAAIAAARHGVGPV